jgi:hypothetical protein
MDTWRTKDGREMPVSQMEDSHLLRSIRLVESRLVDLGLQDTGKDKLAAKFRAVSIEQAQTHLKILKREADRRKLGDWGKFGIGLVKKVLD